MEGWMDVEVLYRYIYYLQLQLEKGDLMCEGAALAFKSNKCPDKAVF